MGQKIFDWLLGRFAPIENRPLALMATFGIVMLALRLALARPFWNSGQTRWVSFPTDLASSTNYLFANEFKLNFFWGSYPIPFPGFVGYMTGMAEIILPILLVIGLFSRLWALGLFVMTFVIQLVFPGAFWNPATFWDTHSVWFALSILIIVLGPGQISLDWAVRRFGLSRLKQS